MKKIYLFIPALFLSLGLLAQTPAPEVQKVDSLRTDTVGVEESETLSLITEIVEENKTSPFPDKDPVTTTATFTSSNTFTVPQGVFSITVEVWGGGGKGGTRTSNGPGAGGGGGAYSRSVLTVEPGDIYQVEVGVGSSTTAAGGDSWFGSQTTVMAKGGNSVPNNSNAVVMGGSAASGSGDVKYNGGNGATGRNSILGRYGGGGGSSGGSA